MCADMVKNASRHYIAPRLYASFPRCSSIAATIIDIISCICVQKSTATDQYSSSYGPAKYDVAMASFEVKTRRAITRWTLVRCRWFLHANAVNDVGYCWCIRGTTAKGRVQTRRNIVAWRQISWFVDGISRIITYSNIFLCAIVRGRIFWGRKACASVAFFWTLCNCGCSDRCIWYVRWMDNTISTYERPRTKNNNIGKEVESSRATQGDRLGKNLKILLRSNFSLNMSICPICST